MRFGSWPQRSECQNSVWPDLRPGGELRKTSEVVTGSSGSTEAVVVEIPAFASSETSLRPHLSSPCTYLITVYKTAEIPPKSEQVDVGVASNRRLSAPLHLPQSAKQSSII